MIGRTPPGCAGDRPALLPARSIPLVLFLLLAGVSFALAPPTRADDEMGFPDVTTGGYWVHGAYIGGAEAGGPTLTITGVKVTGPDADAFEVTPGLKGTTVAAGSARHF